MLNRLNQINKYNKKIRNGNKNNENNKNRVTFNDKNNNSHTSMMLWQSNLNQNVIRYDTVVNSLYINRAIL